MVDDALPSWNDGAAKARLVDFTRRVTVEGGPSFVPPARRIATFDNDGTLWPEQPTCIQFIFAFDRLKKLAEAHPEWMNTPPFQSVLEGGLQALAALDSDGLIEIIKATQSGMSTDQFSNIVMEWLATTKDQRFGRVYTDLVYQPMLELLDYLRANEFKIFIVSGAGQDFIRVFAEETYRIPPEQVIGSTIVAEFRSEKCGPVLMKLPKVDVIDDGPGKPVAVERFIGRRPIFAFGNSEGDKELMEWTAAGPGARFVGLLHHTDALREWAYDRDSKIGRLDRSLDQARAAGWTVVNMATDWKAVFLTALRG